MTTSRKVRRLALAFCALAAASMASAARAQPVEPRPVTSALSWTRLPGAEACIDAGALARAVERRLGRFTFVSPARADVTIEGRVEPAGAGFRAMLLATNRDGERIGARELHTERSDCGALSEPLALVIALMIDPAGRPPEREEEPEPRTVVVPAPSRWGFDAGIAGRLQVGALPSVTPGVELELRVEPPSAIPLALFGGLFASADAGTGESPDRAASVGAYYGGIGACPNVGLDDGGLALEVCGRAVLGVYAASPRGFDASREATLWFFDVEARVSLVVPIAGPLVWRPGIGALIALYRPALSYVVSPAVSGEEAPRSVPLFAPSWVSLTVDMVVAIAID